MARFLGKGDYVEIEGYATGEDMTGIVLAEILLKQMKVARNLLSLPLPLMRMFRGILSRMEDIAHESCRRVAHIFEQSGEEAAEADDCNITEKVQQALDEIEQEYAITKKSLAELEHRVADLIFSRESGKLSGAGFRNPAVESLTDRQGCLFHQKLRLFSQTRLRVWHFRWR